MSKSSALIRSIPQNIYELSMSDYIPVKEVETDEERVNRETRNEEIKRAKLAVNKAEEHASYFVKGETERAINEMKEQKLKDKLKAELGFKVKETGEDNQNLARTNYGNYIGQKQDDIDRARAHIITLGENVVKEYMDAGYTTDQAIAEVADHLKEIKRTRLEILDYKYPSQGGLAKKVF